MTIAAIETRYAGCRFRSRLEARWAVFFDHLGIRWEYEPQGYSTPDGPYLPDFLLHIEKPTLFEVKPEVELGNVDPRWGPASAAAGHRMVVAYGIPRDDELQPSRQPGDGLLNLVGSGDPGYPTWDNYHAFCTCPECGSVGIEFDGRGGRVCESGHARDDKAYSYDDPWIARAYRAARSARFEHGERG